MKKIILVEDYGNGEIQWFNIWSKLTSSTVLVTFNPFCAHACSGSIRRCCLCEQDRAPCRVCQRGSHVGD